MIDLRLSVESSFSFLNSDQKLEVVSDEFLTLSALRFANFCCEITIINILSFRHNSGSDEEDGNDMG